MRGRGTLSVKTLRGGWEKAAAGKIAATARTMGYGQEHSFMERQRSFFLGREIDGIR